MLTSTQKAYRKGVSYSLGIGVLLIPSISLAAFIHGQCSQDGYTIATINGVFTNKEGAEENMIALQNTFGLSHKDQDIDYHYLLNPSHLGGAGDIVMSAYQKYFESETVQDYDLIEMLKDASEKVSTQKILLVAHSQGNFYANSFYTTVTKQIVGGIPRESIGVYGVANPANRVAGDGLYLTSETDRVITVLTPNAPTNDRIEEVSNESYPPATHYFSEVYLRYHGNRIVREIQQSLSRLKTNGIQDPQKPCLAPPKITLMHNVEGHLLGIADPMVHTGVLAIAEITGVTYRTSVMLVQGAGQGIAALNHSASFAIAAAGQALGNIFKDSSGTSASSLFESFVTKNDIGESGSQQSSALPSSQPTNLSSQAGDYMQEGLDPRFRGDDNGGQYAVSVSPTPISQKNSAGPTSKPFPGSSSLSQKTAEQSGGGASFASFGASQQSSGAVLIAEAVASNTPQPAAAVFVSPTPSPGVSVSPSPSPTPAATSSATTTATTAAPFPSASPSPSPSASPTPTPTTSSTPAVDTQAPSLSFSISQCAASLSPDGCLMATSTIMLKWSSPDNDLAHYILGCTTNGTACLNFSFASTTATTTIYIAPSDAMTYIFTAKAVDMSGNESNAQTAAVDVWLHPVVINEIAWAGTGGSATTDKDEWLELYNPTSKRISLSGMAINAPTNPSLKINLVNTIAAKSFYLIERKNDDVVADIPADLTASFGKGLSNSGEQLVLMLGSTTIDKTPAVGAAGCSQWCAGIASGLYYTMERYDPLSTGENSANWGSWQNIVRYGANAEAQPIKGTPKHRNATNYLIVNSSNLNADKTITKANSPYVSGQTVIGSSATLTIESGVVIKFIGATGGLYGNGVINVQGTQADPVILTSFADDTYAGDTNQNGTSTLPQAGDWGSVRLLKNGSSLDYAVIRYGGGDSEKANVKIKNSFVTITHSTIEQSKYYGVYLDHANGAIESNVIQNNIAQHNNESAGIYVADGDVLIRNNIITENYIGVGLVSNDTPQNIRVENNTFLHNVKEAVNSSNHAWPSFAGNIAAGNGRNGIIILGINRDYTLSPDLPYIFSGYTVGANTILTILPGVVIKFEAGGQLSVAGSLHAQGAAGHPIVFTSIRDDDCGIAGGCGDTDNASTTPAAGDWFAVRFISSSGASVLEYVTLRFGGKNISTGNPGAISIVNTSAAIDITHATIEKNYYAGIRLEHASPHISDSLIQDHTGTGGAQYYGLFPTASSTPVVTNTHFKNNDVHIYANDTTSSYVGGGNVME